MVVALTQHLARSDRLYLHRARYPKAVRPAAFSAADACPHATIVYSGGCPGSLRRPTHSCWPIHSARGVHSCRGDGSGILHGPRAAQFLATVEQGRERCTLLLYLPVPNRGGWRSLEHRSALGKGFEGAAHGHVTASGASLPAKTHRQSARCARRASLTPFPQPASIGSSLRKE
jgi:hypothetical protein